MSIGQQLRDLNAALAMTEQMVSGAEHHEWHLLRELETNRQRLLKAAFADPIPPADRAAVADVVHRIQALNEDLLSIGRQGRKQLAHALSTMATGRRARSAYSNASGR